MKKVSKRFKSQRGSITTVVLVTVLFFVTILSTAFIVASTNRKGQIKSEAATKSTYEKDIDRTNQIVANIKKELSKEWKIKRDENATINGEEGNSYNPTIPAGYIPVNTETSDWGDGSSSPSQDSVDHGLVIRDENDNEWVWIPVDSETLAKMVETSTEAKTLCGTSGETAVTTNKYSKTITIGKDNNTETISRTTPGTSTSDSYREPDLVVKYDAQDTYYKTILGETGTKEQLAKLFVAEYNEMITSIAKYGGFYIGRYELSGTVTDPTEKSGVTLTKTNWYNLYNACRSSKLQASDKVKTQMIWGIQWDVTCDFIANKGEQKNIKDSSNWGNYSDSTGNAKVTVTENGTETNKYGSKQNTGYSEYWKANNIYDLAGNCWEWTQEAYSTNYRAVRGGFCSGGGSSGPASGRNGSGPYGSSYGGVRFSSHFNNKTIERLILTV